MQMRGGTGLAHNSHEHCPRQDKNMGRRKRCARIIDGAAKAACNS